MTYLYESELTPEEIGKRLRSRTQKLRRIVIAPTGDAYFSRDLGNGRFCLMWSLHGGLRGHYCFRIAVKKRNEGAAIESRCRTRSIWIAAYVLLAAYPLVEIINIAIKSGPAGWSLLILLPSVLKGAFFAGILYVTLRVVNPEEKDKLLGFVETNLLKRE